jgi:hypothetical protein
MLPFLKGPKIDVESASELRLRHSVALAYRRNVNIVWQHHAPHRKLTPSLQVRKDLPGALLEFQTELGSRPGGAPGLLILFSRLHLFRDQAIALLISPASLCNTMRSAGESVVFLDLAYTDAIKTCPGRAAK